MANNEYINKVEYGNETLIDITSTTAEEDDVIEGKSFFLKSGAPAIGTLGDATTNGHGLMSAADKSKLDNIQEGAAVSDVQINLTSILSNGIANIPIASESTLGVIKVSGALGTGVDANNRLAVVRATSANIKAGAEEYRPVVPQKQHEAVFYGLATAAGDSTQGASSNSVGIYTSNALASIQSMLAVPSNTNPVFTGTLSLNRAANTTIGTNSVSIGDNCTASAEDSLAEGRYTNASGYYSHAEGNYTTALGMASHAEGTVTIANHASQHVFGEYNVSDSSAADTWARGNYVEIVGNGTASNAQSNARALDWSGNEYLNGYLYVGCNASSGSGTRIPHDIQINSTSIVNNGVATLPIASTANIKTGTSNSVLITPSTLDSTTFYGLAKAAGDSTQAASNNNVGYYTDTAKVKIQQMLGIQTQAWELIREDTFTNATEDSHTITTDSSGNSFALTDVFFMFETPKVADAAAEKGTYGQIHFYYDTNSYFASEGGAWTQAANSSAHGCMVWITQELGGLFVLRYTMSATTSNGAQWRTRYGAGFTSSAQGAQVYDSVKLISKIVIPTVTGTGHYKLFGKRQITL